MNQVTPSRAQQAIVVVASLAVQTALSFPNQVLGPLAPALTSGLGLSSSNIGFLLSAFYLGAILLTLPGGIASDRIGPRWLFLAGPALVCAAMWAASVGGTYAILVVCMFVAGLGNAVSLPSTTRAIMDWFTATGGRATAMSIKQTGVAVAGVIAAVVIPLIVVPLGWRGSMAAIAFTVVGVGIVATIFYPRGGLVREPGPGQAGHVKPPPDPPRVRLQLWMIAAYTFAIAGVQLSFQSFFVLFLHQDIHYSLPLAGGLLAIAQASGVAARIGWSVVSDALWKRNRRPALFGIGAMAFCAVLVLAFASPGTPFVVMLAAAVLFGASGIGWNGIMMVYVAESAGLARTGAAAGVNLIASYAAIFAVPPIFGTIVDYTHGFRAGFAALAVLVVLTMAFVIPMRERIRDGLPE